MLIYFWCPQNPIIFPFGVQPGACFPEAQLTNLSQLGAEEEDEKHQSLRTFDTAYMLPGKSSEFFHGFFQGFSHIEISIAFP